MNPLKSKNRNMLKNVERVFKQVRLAAILFLALFIINVILNPQRFSPHAVGRTIGMMSPLILASAAVMVVFLSGGGGIDISIGPFMTLVNVIIVQVLFVSRGITSAFIVVPAALFLGVLSGTLNGMLSNVLLIQPIVATLGTYLIYSGLSVWIMPSPGGVIPVWMAKLSSTFSFIPLLVVFTGWAFLKRTVFYDQLMATGGDDRAAYSSAVNVTAVRICAYILTGVIGSIAALSLGALIGSADANVGIGYTMTAIAGAALGGVSLAGGQGNLLGAVLGAIDIFLIQSILTYIGVSPFAMQIAYGAILVFSLIIDSPNFEIYFKERRRCK